MTPLNAAAASITFSCSTPACFVEPDNLIPGQNYSVVATAIVGGGASSPSAPTTFLACFLPEECWGSNSVGLLGVNNTVQYSPMAPPRVSQAPRWARHYVAYSRQNPSYTLAIQANDSTLWGWGSYPRTVQSSAQTTSYINPPALLPTPLFPQMTWKSGESTIATGLEHVGGKKYWGTSLLQGHMQGLLPPIAMLSTRHRFIVTGVCYSHQRHAVCVGHQHGRADRSMAGLDRQPAHEPHQHGR